MNKNGKFDSSFIYEGLDFVKKSRKEFLGTSRWIKMEKWKNMSGIVGDCWRIFISLLDQVAAFGRSRCSRSKLSLKTSIVFACRQSIASTRFICISWPRICSNSICNSDFAQRSATHNRENSLHWYDAPRQKISNQSICHVFVDFSCLSFL